MRIVAATKIIFLSNVITNVLTRYFAAHEYTKHACGIHSSRTVKTFVSTL